jgi:hypothetical protein
MKKSLKIALVCALALLMPIGCCAAPANAADSYSAAYTAPEPTVSDRDASGAYDASEAVTLSPDGDLAIRSAGTYILSGNYKGMLVVEAGEEEKVQLVLENAAITNENGPAIYVRSADKVFLTAVEGTVNEISDGSDYTFTDGDTTPDAAVFSKADLTVNGAGRLTINGNCKHALVSKDDLVITAKDLSVNAKNVGLSGKDSVSFSEAAVSITAGSDGVRSDNDTDAAKGFVSAADSTLSIVSGNDGIQAATVFTAENAGVSIISGGGSSARSGSAEESCKGIKAGNAITIGSGTYRIDSLDDAIHTDGSILISDGVFTLLSPDDAIHANEKVTISGGTLSITAYEGIEGSYILISGGDITIASSGDGINAAHKSSSLTPTVEITGGTVSVTMGAGDTDGIDSNGNIIISGGTISVNGQSAFDCDGSVSFTGGTVYINGQQVSTIPNQMMGRGQGGPGGQGGFGGHGAFGDQEGDFSGGPGGRGDFGEGHGVQGDFGGGRRGMRP